MPKYTTYCCSLTRDLRSTYHGRKHNGVSFKVEEGNLTSNAFLRRAGVAEADAVILGELAGQAGLRPVDADAQVSALG